MECVLVLFRRGKAFSLYSLDMEQHWLVNVLGIPQNFGQKG